MLVEALADKNSRLLELVERWGIIHSQGSEDDGANEGRKYQRCRCCGVIAWDGKAMQHKVKCEVGATLAEKQIIQAAARVYLSTRAQQEEALIEAGYAQRAAKTALDAISPKDTQGPWGTALEACIQTGEGVEHAVLALPVKGSAPPTYCRKEVRVNGTDRETCMGLEPCSQVHIDDPQQEGRAPDASHEKKLGKKGAK